MPTTFFNLAVPGGYRAPSWITRTSSGGCIELTKQPVTAFAAYIHIGGGNKEVAFFTSLWNFGQIGRKLSLERRRHWLDEPDASIHWAPLALWRVFSYSLPGLPKAANNLKLPTILPSVVLTFSFCDTRSVGYDLRHLMQPKKSIQRLLEE